jgi:hypothetical protein
MKTTACRCLALAFAVAGFLTTSPLRAAVLFPGATIAAASSSFSIGGSLLGSVTTPFSVGTLSGTLISDVYSASSSNPFGGLTFTYSLSVNPSSADSSSELTVGSFRGFATDVSYQLSDSQVAPAFFSRNGLGDTFRSTWLPNTINPGQMGALVVVQTDATAFGATTAGIIDSMTVNVASLAPVPEPGMASVLLVGAGTLLALRRKRS